MRMIRILCSASRMRLRHDDQCDSISQALLDKNMSFMTWLSPEDWDNLLAQSRIRTRKSF
jgi:hypothetical protein